MSIENRITKISSRIEKFLNVNEKVYAFDLKFHLNCRTSELLMALGRLHAEDKVSLVDDKKDIRIISREPAGK